MNFALFKDTSSVYLVIYHRKKARYRTEEKVEKCNYGLRLNSAILGNKMKKPTATSEKLTSHPEDNIKINMDNYPMILKYRLDTIDSVYYQWWKFYKNIQ
jgi:hypothetical protein